MIQKILKTFLPIILISIISISICYAEELQFKFEDHFQKVGEIVLSEVESQMCRFIFTEFGFFVLENNMGKLSKYNNETGFEYTIALSDKRESSHFNWRFASYDEKKGTIGILNAREHKVSLYSLAGEYIETKDQTNKNEVIYKLDKLKIGKAISGKLVDGEYKVSTELFVNGKSIIKGKLKNSIYDMDICYSINDGTPYILDQSRDEINIYSYDPKKKKLKDIELNSDQLSQKSVTKYVSFNNYLIFETFSDKKHFFTLSGEYLGSVDRENVNTFKEFQGSYGKYLYSLSPQVGGKKVVFFMEIYEAK